MRTWDPKRPYTLRHDGVGWSIYRRKGEKVYQFEDGYRGEHEATIARRLMNIAYREGRERALRGGRKP